jgi:hypothetical protein
MRRRLFVVRCLTAVVALATIGLASSPAAADAPRDKGWWTVTNPGGLPAAPPAPPDVPATGLLIQGGPSAPTAFAALVYELDPGVTAGSLTLTVAPNSLTTPSTSLQICALIQPIVHPDQGGPLSDAPAYNCGKKVTVAPDSSGKDYKFDTSGLMADRLVAIAILPNSPVDRVVLSAPDANSLATQQGGSSDSVPPAVDTGPTTASSEPAVDLPGGLSSSPLPTPSVASGLPSVGASPFLGPSGQAPQAAPPGNAAGAFVPAVSSTPSNATPLLFVVFVIGALGGAALWVYAGRQSGSAAISGP